MPSATPTFRSRTFRRIALISWLLRSTAVTKAAGSSQSFASALPLLTCTCGGSPRSPLRRRTGTLSIGATSACNHDIGHVARQTQARDRPLAAPCHRTERYPRERAIVGNLGPHGSQPLVIWWSVEKHPRDQPHRRRSGLADQHEASCSLSRCWRPSGSARRGGSGVVAQTDVLPYFLILGTQYHSNPTGGGQVMSGISARRLSCMHGALALLLVAAAAPALAVECGDTITGERAAGPRPHLHGRPGAHGRRRGCSTWAASRWSAITIRPSRASASCSKAAARASGAARSPAVSWLSTSPATAAIRSRSLPASAADRGVFIESDGNRVFDSQILRARSGTPRSRSTAPTICCAATPSPTRAIRASRSTAARVDFARN